MLIDNFTRNGLITELRLDEKNFITLPSAFNSHTMRIRGDHELRYSSTAPDFVKRAYACGKSVLDQARRTENDAAFSNIVKWIEFTNEIFNTVTRYPDLTFFNTLAEREQERKLQEHLNTLMAAELSVQVKTSLFDEFIHLSDSFNHTGIFSHLPFSSFLLNS